MPQIELDVKLAGNFARLSLAQVATEGAKQFIAALILLSCGRVVLPSLRRAGIVEGSTTRVTDSRISEDQFQCDLPNSGIHRRPESREVSITDRREIVDGAFVAQEVNVVEDVEVFASQLHLETFGNCEGL
jgi:hypothetical protein